METVNKLESVQNKYPSLQNYKKTSDTLFTLFGKYNQNKLNFDIKSFSDITVIPNTKFSFLLLIKVNENNQETLYTSENFYKLLRESFDTVNPYFLQFIRKNELIVELNLKEIISIYESFQTLEDRDKVTITKNIFFETTEDENNPYIINYTKLVEYIDWVVSDVNPIDIEKDGVINFKDISEYTIEERESLNPFLGEED